MQGLTVVGVTDEPDRPTDQWIRKHGARFAYARVADSSLMAALGLNFYPSAALIGKDGKLLWSGHPGRLPEELLRAQLP